MVRFTGRQNALDRAGDRWGPMRFVYIQHASDPMTFFSPDLLLRRPAWLNGKRGPDVSPYLDWYPIVTFLQIGFDLPMALGILAATAATIVAQEEAPPETEPTLDGRLSSYLAFALARSPELRASFERWRAATMRISRARRIPEPIIKYSYFVRAVETRVGPQNHKLSLMQSFPWPTALSAGADAASSKARAAQRRFDGEVLQVQRAVADAYWRLWLVHEDGSETGIRGENALRFLNHSRRPNAELQELDLKVTSVQETNETIPAGIVIATEPPAGTEVDGGIWQGLHLIELGIFIGDGSQVGTWSGILLRSTSTAVIRPVP